MLMPQLNLKPELSSEKEAGRWEVKEGDKYRSPLLLRLQALQVGPLIQSHVNTALVMKTADKAGNRHFPGRTQDEKALSTP